MKVGLIIPAMGRGGAERQVEVMASGLKARGHEAFVMVFYGGGTMEDNLARYGVPLMDLHKRGRADFFGFLFRLWRAVRREQPHVVIAHLGVPNMAASLLNPFWPKTRIVLGVMGIAYDLKFHDWLWRFCAYVEPKAARLADLVMSNSKAGAEDAIKAGFPSGKMIVIPNGFNTEDFKFDLQGRERFRKEWGVADHERLIGITARLAPMKDHPNFLKAAAILAERRPEARFVCIGAGEPEYTEGLRNLANGLGLAEKVIWAGSKQNMPAVYSALDMGCLASRFGEGLSNAVAEAMACGVPCAITDLADTPDVVRGLGEICPAENSEALAAAMDRLWERLDNEGQQFKDAVRQRIIDQYSLDRHLDRVEDMLAKLTRA